MRYALCLAFAFSLGACSKSSPPATDPKFDQAWSQLAKSGVEPAFVEGDLHGAGLLGEIRRAADHPPIDGRVADGNALPGPLPDAEVARVIRQNLGAVKGCYQLAERDGTVGSGKAIVNIEISPSGAVTSATVDAPAFESSHLPGCMTMRARAWTFPKFTEGPKRFSYPFVFVGG
jgi:hypothetical protein